MVAPNCAQGAVNHSRSVRVAWRPKSAKIPSSTAMTPLVSMTRSKRLQSACGGPTNGWHQVPGNATRQRVRELRPPPRPRGHALVQRPTVLLGLQTSLPRPLVAGLASALALPPAPQDSVTILSASAKWSANYPPVTDLPLAVGQTHSPGNGGDFYPQHPRLAFHGLVPCSLSMMKPNSRFSHLS